MKELLYLLWPRQYLLRRNKIVFYVATTNTAILNTLGSVPGQNLFANLEFVSASTFALTLNFVSRGSARG